MYQKFPNYYGWVQLDEDTIAITMEFVAIFSTGNSTIPWELFPTTDAGFLINDLKCDKVLLHQVNNHLTHSKIIDFRHTSHQNQPRRVYILSEEEKRRYITERLYCHVALEVALDGKEPTVQSDILQVGQTLKRMGQVLKLDIIYVLGSRCCHEDPTMRPSGSDSSAGNQLGWGTNRVVYLYKHAKTQRPIAVKKFKLPGDQYYRNH